MTATDHRSLAAPSEAVWRGVSTLLDEYMGVRGDDLVFILYTADARESAAWVAAGLAARGVTAQTVGMNPVRDDALERRLAAVLPDPSRALTSRIVLLTLERNSMSHAKLLRRLLAPYAAKDCAVFRMINASAEGFTYSMNVTPGLLSALNGGLLNRMIGASRLQISSSSGTDLDIRLDSERYPWLSNRGVLREGGFVILPAGEVSTFPADVNGVLVADGAFNVTAYTKADARLGDHPVTAWIENGRVVGTDCADPDVTRLLARCLTVPNGDRIGELGFGTNVGTHGFVPMNSHINERRPGVHLGLGQHGMPVEVAGYHCDMHLDLITSDAIVTVDGHTRIDSRELRRFEGESHPAPLSAGIRDQDIDGDCCGLTALPAMHPAKESFQTHGCR